MQLNETAHILFDAIGMIKSDPKLASEVLPYGGKFATAAVTPRKSRSRSPRPEKPGQWLFFARPREEETLKVRSA